MLGKAQPQLVSLLKSMVTGGLVDGPDAIQDVPDSILCSSR